MKTNSQTLFIRNNFNRYPHYQCIWALVFTSPSLSFPSLWDKVSLSCLGWSWTFGLKWFSCLSAGLQVKNTHSALFPYDEKKKTKTFFFKQRQNINMDFNHWSASKLNLFYISMQSWTHVSARMITWLLNVYSTPSLTLYWIAWSLYK